jgi:hypothetical protein
MRPDRAFVLSCTVSGVLLAALATSTEARAFCRSTTSPVPPDFNPTQGRCWTQGAPLFWANACVGYSLQRDASRHVDLATASRLVDRAFETWNAAACSGDDSAEGGADVSPRNPSIHATQLGNVACNVVGYDTTGPNQNSIVFRDDSWPHGEGNETYALTTVTFDTTTGEIFDADMEINTAQSSFSLADPVPPDGYDLESVLTHEAGHFLGLAHSASADAAMSPTYMPGSTHHRQLAPDDVAAICSAYNPDGTRLTAAGPVPAMACDPTPRHGFASECTPPTPPTPSTKNGWTCTAAPGDADPPLLATVLAAMLACAAVARRKR